MGLDRPSRDTWFFLVVVLVHLLLPVGLWITIRIGRPRFVGLGLYLTMAVLLIDALLLFGQKSVDTAFISALDARIPTLLLIGSVGMLALFGQGILFYLSISATIVTVLMRVLGGADSARFEAVDLGLISGSSILLLASKIFTVAYYVRVPDTINHLTASIVLLDGGSLAAISETRYFAFSAFHIFVSTVTRFTQLEPRFAAGVLVIGLFQVALVAVYLFFWNWSRSRSLAVIGTLLVSINISFLHYGSIVHYQSMSFVLFCVFLGVLSTKAWGARDVLILTIVMTTWIVTHHVTVLMAIALLAVPVSYLAIRTWQGGRSAGERPTVYLYTAFCLMFGTYWVMITSKFQELLVWTFFTSSAAEGVPSDIYLVRAVESLEQLFSEATPFLVDSLHYSFLLALTGVGVFVVYTTDRISTTRWRLVGLGFMPAAVLYFPNPVWVPLEGLIPFSRWRLMVLPFLMLIPAAGFRYSMSISGHSSLRQVGVLLITGILVFITITSGMSNPGLTDLAGFEKGSQQHLSDEELQAAEFTHAHMNQEQQVYSRSELYVYLRQYAWAENRPFDSEQFARLQASRMDRQLVINPGLTVMSVDAFSTEGIYVDLVEVNISQYDGTRVGRSIYATDYQWDRTEADVVYSNGAVDIQHR